MHLTAEEIDRFWSRLVISHQPRYREVDVSAELLAARTAIDRALAALARTDSL